MQCSCLINCRHQFLGASYNQVCLDFEVIHAFNSLLLFAHLAVLSLNLFLISLTTRLKKQGSKFIFGLGRTCATRCKFLGALPKF